MLAREWRAIYNIALVAYWVAVANRAWRRKRMGSLRDKIQSTPDGAAEVMDVSEWDVKIEIRSMTARTRAKMLRQSLNADNELDFEILYPAVLIACCFDPEDGTAVFESGDVDWINEKASGPVERLAQAVMRLSGLTKEAVEAGKEDS